ncbi:stage II sporulation protein D [Halobacillus naozhouensis]|uniref:Stage II sporulation protein D n=1 Tax=Halobacillus naozhouensis TaxID=554880 RepID=A0ABY8IVW6_9BACI|nr:stage II sporulation protein D [Halobacillus naozhouensis]WFT74357.1 stage II sporulation protein D [Halobacillus naozhouensis]
MKRRNRIGIIVLSSIFVGILLIPTLIVVPFTGSNNTAQVEETPAPATNADESVTELPASLSPFSIHVLRSKTKEVEEVPLETYVSRVVASEMPASFELEALKAQALAARTYITRHLAQGEPISENADVTDTVQHQVYKNDQELRDLWGENYKENISKINRAVKATAGEIITYKQQPIDAAFFSTSNGYTENSEDYWQAEIPYLKSVKSPWDKASPKFNDQKIIPVSGLESSLGVDIMPTLSNMELTKTEGGRVDQITIGSETFSGRQIREEFNLQSSDFTMEVKNNHVIFTTQGYGHGVGMSQYGANGMAKAGKTYKEIIHHYYQNTEISPMSKQTAAITTAKQTVN